MGKESRRAPIGKLYSGVLAEPLPWHSIPLPNARPWWFKGTEDEWRQKRRNLVRTDMERFCECRLQLYRHFNIDLNDPDADSQLVGALVAADPIPAFQSPPKRAGQPTRLREADTITLLAEVARITAIERQRTGAAPSDARLAKELSKTPVCKTRPLGEDRIRALLRDLRSAPTAYARGTATEFQRHLIEVIVPFLMQGREPGG